MPGIRTSVAGMSPAKMLQVTVVTMAAIACWSLKKNVIGTSKATAMVAVRPGIDPTKIP